MLTTSSADVADLPGRADTPPQIRHIPTRRVSLRVKLSRIRAMLRAILGRGGGFFVQYPYAAHLQPVTTPYPEVEDICARSEFPQLLDEMQRQLPAIHQFGEAPADPVLGRGMFPALDGMATYAAVRRFRPNRVLEIGSGDSTHFLAKAVADNGVGSVTCIDPQPRRELSRLNVNFKRRLMTPEDAEFAALLEPNDILFIDSSHIMLPGMDVDIQFNRIFPRLKKGVIVHVHDIFLPDDYPPHWRYRNYSEQNALIGWIISGYFDILWPGRYVITRHDAMIQKVFSDIDLGMGLAGSLWLRKH